MAVAATLTAVQYDKPMVPTSVGASTSLALNSAATTNATLVKTGACTLFALAASNIGAAAAFLKLYNRATAPVVGTTAPVLTVPIPAGSHVSLNLSDIGLRFPLGFGVAITNLAADSDTTAVAANQVKVIASVI